MIKFKISQQDQDIKSGLLPSLSPLTITMISIIVITFIIFTLLFLYWLHIYLLQRKENQILIRFNRIKSNQAIKREKYISTITTKDNKLFSIVKFLKKSINNYENQLRITESNVILLRKIKQNSSFLKYRKEMKIINYDLDVLEKNLQTIDGYAIDSKAFKESNLSLLIHIRRGFFQFESFYREHLLPNEFVNQPLYDLISVIQNDLAEISDLICTVDKDNLIEKFDSIIKEIGHFAIWTLRSYSSFQKLIKIKDLYSESITIKNEQNLHFAHWELDEINKNSKFISDNYSLVETNLKKGKLSKSKNLINEMLIKSLNLSLKIKLIAEHENLLNDVFLKTSIVNKADWVLEEFNSWAYNLVEEWKKNFEETAETLFKNSKKIIDILLELSRERINLSVFKNDIMNKTNHELLSQSIKISQSLSLLSNEIEETSNKIFEMDKKVCDLMEKIWKLNIYLPQLIGNAELLIEVKSQDFKRIKELFDKSDNLIKNGTLGYDKLILLESDYEEINQEFLIYKKIIEQRLQEKLLAEGLYRFWKAKSLNFSEIDYEIDEKLFESLKTKKWILAINSCLSEIEKLQIKIGQIESLKINKKSIFNLISSKVKKNELQK